jgi:hypothetical protein
VSMLLLVASAAAAEPPVLKSLSISPSSVNATSASATVTATAHITDNGPGVQYAFLALFSPSRHQQVEPGMHLVSGTDTNGIYEGKLVIPAGSESGAWKARVRLRIIGTRYLESACDRFGGSQSRQHR